MNAEEMRRRLPLQLDRQFRPWSYRVTQRRLELRSDKNFENGETLYVAFLDVLAMKVKHVYESLHLAEIQDAAAIDQFVGIPERHAFRYMRLSVGDGSQAGFVVCAMFDIRVEPPES